MDDDEICQDVKEVADYSSQYGSYNSISYVALNVIGAPEVFPEYGDYSETFSARTYGPWWLLYSISDRNFKTILPKERYVKSQDYVELQYEHLVHPLTVTVFETYNPGSVVRILAFDRLKNRWKELWVGKPTKGAEACAWPRPLPMENMFATRALRLEFHHAHLDYHAQIDAVLLAGLLKRPEPPVCESDEQSSAAAVTTRSSCKQEAFLPSSTGFHSLPHELMTEIFRYLDLLSICRLSGTCKLFWKVCYDHIFYRCLDLQPYWEKIDDNALDALQKRCATLEKLNLSWCGAGGYLSAEAFVSFMELRGELLQCLCLSSCPFVDNECLKVIADYCPNLTELELKGCCNPLLNRLGFLQISHLSKLVWLDLCRTEIEMFSLISIIRSCSKLEHLSLGSCPVVNNYDDIALEIGMYLGTSIESGCIQELARGCPHLKRLLLTAVRVLCDSDLFALATHCHDLEHLDILGSAEASSSGVAHVLNVCKQLKILDVSFCFNISLDFVQEWKRLYPKVQIKRSISDAFR
ncbi:F-box/LRR-repeat protein 4-like isoform X2 [Dermacentor andersoni]|uniref:F-box/LRR-repeat protein 4-like isoform X2 n=1 Tax=Dermacentor andersoni TaxID=34620 RepID=UPI002416D633|nr:F-box/LRR-repeat protein 4-like isoform X2 [Dermacentor andersoni]